MTRLSLLRGDRGGHFLAVQQVRVLRIYLAATTALYTVGVGLTLFPVREGQTLANPAGGIIAIVLGAGALSCLALAPGSPMPAVVAAIAATPVVMAFHELASAEFVCLIAAMFLAMYLRAFYRPAAGWCMVGALTVACVLALAIAPAPKYATTYLIFVVAIIGAAESFGIMARALITLACTDPLTGLLNRAGWDIATTNLLAATTDQDIITIIALDIDNLKTINDTHGHHAGDQHLIDHAHHWQKLAPPGAVLARLGGDEFAVAIAAPSPTPAQQFLTDIAEQSPDTSAGSATAPADSASTHDLHLAADTALYDTKRRRRPNTH